MKFGLLLAAAILTVGATPATAADERSEVAREASPTLQAPGQAIEGDRIPLTVRVPAARKAKRVTIETRSEDLWGNSSWTPVKGTAVRGKAKVALRATATALNRQVFRAKVTYKDKRVLRSRPKVVTVWRWIPIAAFDSYYSTHGVSDHQYAQYPINGHQYRGWFGGGTHGSWESRYTLGRHCRTMRGVFGVTDSSADGSTAQISIAADGKSVFSSPTLTPGTSYTRSFNIGQPYRIAIIAANPTAESELYAFPAIGDAAFLCTGV